MRIDFEVRRGSKEAIVLSPGGLNVAGIIPIGQWHTSLALESV